MSEKVVAHFYVAELVKNSYSPEAVTVKLRVVSNEQNKTWAAATPNGELTMTIKNALAQDLFVNNLGREVEVLISLLPEKTP